MLLSNFTWLLLHLALVIAICVMGFQDWKTREVSNTINVPLFIIGMGACLLRLVERDPLAPVAVGVIILLTVTALRGWMGGADWKTLVGLWGVWPIAGLTALIGAGVWGLVAMLRTHDRNVRFPGITAFSIAVVLTFLGEVSIIVFNKV